MYIYLYELFDHGPTFQALDILCIHVIMIIDIHIPPQIDLIVWRQVDWNEGILLKGGDAWGDPFNPKEHNPNQWKLVVTQRGETPSKAIFLCWDFVLPPMASSPEEGHQMLGHSWLGWLGWGWQQGLKHQIVEFTAKVPNMQWMNITANQMRSADSSRLVPYLRPAWHVELCFIQYLNGNVDC